MNKVTSKLCGFHQLELRLLLGLKEHSIKLSDKPLWLKASSQIFVRNLVFPVRHFAGR